MATYYVYSGATGAGTGADWANAYTTLTTAFAGKAAGDTFYVAHDHAESTAAAAHLTLQPPGTVSTSPCNVLCVDRSGSVPPVSADLRTTASVAMTAGSYSIIFAPQWAYWYGIQFSAGSGSNFSSITFSQNTNVTTTFEKCSFTLNNTNASARFNLNGGNGSGTNLIYLYCTFTFGSSTSQCFTSSLSSVVAKFVGGSFNVGANVPNTCFSGTPSVLELWGVDLSAFGSGKTLIATSGVSSRTIIRDCRVGSSVTVAQSITSSNQEVLLIRSDSGATTTRTEKSTWTGLETTETTIVRTGGATDGTTAVARKIVTTARATWTQPFEGLPMAIWNDTAGSSKTVTVYGIWGGAAVPNNDDIWIEVGYVGNSSYPLGAIGSGTKADVLATGSALSSDTSTWGGSTTKFKMSVTFTPQMKGPLYVVVKAAKASSTFYYDPRVEVS